jgi:hypothetical protein
MSAQYVPAKRYRWYDLSGAFGYKVGVTAYETGGLVVWWPCGMGKPDRPEIRRYDTGEQAEAAAPRIEQELRALDRALADAAHHDAVAVREVLRR